MVEVETLQAQIETIDAIWAWSEQQPPDASWAARAILAHMANMEADLGATSLTQRVVCSLEELSALYPTAAPAMTVARFDAVITEIAGAEIPFGGLSSNGVRVNRGPLVEAVKTRIDSEGTATDYWLVAPGHWASCLNAEGRASVCRIALASVLGESVASSATIKEIAIALLVASRDKPPMPLSLDLDRIDHGLPVDVLQELLRCLERANLIFDLAFQAGSGSTATFSVTRGA